MKNVVNLIKNNILLLLLGTSVPYIVGYLLYKYQLSNVDEFIKTIWTNLYEIALTVFGSGIFLATLKYFQFLNFFLNEIQNVIYSDTYLREQKNIYEIWQRVTKALFESELPEPVVDNMLSEIFKKFLTKETLDRYYKSLDVRYNVSFEESGFVTIEEWSYYKVINKDKDPIPFGFSYFLSVVDSADITTAIKLESLKINGVNISDTDSTVQSKRDNKQVYLTFEQIFKDLKECEVEQKLVFKQSIHVDREFYYKTNKIVEDLTVTICNQTPDDLGVIFAEIGISTFKKSGASHEIYKGEGILPNGGFRIFFYTKH